MPISDDMGLYVTLGKCYLPDGSSVEGIGLTPDTIVDKNAKEKEIISKALQVIKSKR